MTSKSPSTPSSKQMSPRQRRVLGCVLGLALGPLLLGATEINIGVNNTVNTGKIVGGNCLQGNNKLTKKQLSVDRFTAIAVDGVFVVKVNCGQANALTITADDNLHSLIAAEVKNGTLHLGTTGSYCTAHSFVAEVSLPELASLSAEGSSEIALACSQVSGGRLQLALAGASSMKAAGKAKQLQVTVQDSSELEAYDFVAETVTVKAGDAATARFSVTEKLSGQTEDASTVTYRGQPKSVQVSVADASDCTADE